MWSDALKEEMAALPAEATFEPNDEVEPLDTAVGFLDEELQRLYQLALGWRKKGLELSVQASFISDESARRAAFKEADVFMGKNEAAMSFFWASVRDNFGLWGKSVVLRRDWQIVWALETRRSLIDEILGG